MKRIASIWLPHLAIERWAKANDFARDCPIVLTIEGTHGLIIHAPATGTTSARRRDHPEKP